MKKKPNKQILYHKWNGFPTIRFRCKMKKKLNEMNEDMCIWGKGKQPKKEESQLFIAIWYGRFICRCRCIIHIYRMPDTLKSIHATENPNNFCLTNYIHARTSQRTICTYCTVYCYIHMLNLKYFEYYTVCYISIAYLLTRLLLPSFNPQNWCDTDKYLHTRTHTHARITRTQTKQREKRSQLCLNKLKGSKPFQTTYKFKSTTKTCSLTHAYPCTQPPYSIYLFSNKLLSLLVLLSAHKKRDTNKIKSVCSSALWFWHNEMR